MEIRIANGDKIESMEICNSVIVALQGHHFKFEAYLLSLGSFEVVLGVQWLRTLCLIL